MLEVNAEKFMSNKQPCSFINNANLFHPMGHSYDSQISEIFQTFFLIDEADVL